MTVTFSRSVAFTFGAMSDTDAENFRRRAADLFGVAPINTLEKGAAVDGRILVNAGAYVYDLKELTAMAAEFQESQLLGGEA